MTLRAGSLLADRFRLDDLLEEAAGAKFWKGTDTVLMRDVAVYVLGAADPRALTVLKAARRSSVVSDPRMLRVFDAAMDPEACYVVSEWARGASLDRLIREQSISEAAAMSLVREAANAVAVAHRAGVEHGRLLPENLIVTPQGEVKIMGLAVDAALHEQTPAPSTSNDVKDLAALLYAACVGRWPGSWGSSLPRAPISHDRVLRPRQVRAGVSRELDRLVDAVLRAPERFDAAELSDELGQLLGLGPSRVSLVGADLGHRGPSLDLDDDALTMEVFLTRQPASAEEETAHFDPFPEELETPSGGLGTGNQEPSSRFGVPAASTTDAGTGAIPALRAYQGAAPQAHRDLEPRADWLAAEPEVLTPAKRRSPWPAAAGLVALLVAIGFGLAAFLQLGRPTDDGPEPGASPRALPITSVMSFDPASDSADKTENPGQVRLAFDGNPATGWRTQTYFDGPTLAPYKPGVGLLLDLGSVKSPKSVRLSLVGGVHTVDVLTAPKDATRPGSLEGLSVGATSAAAESTTTLELKGVSTRFLVVWLRALPQVSGGYRGEIAEIVVRS